MNDATARWRFSLRDLFVVITVLALLLSLIWPAVWAARESARRMSCSNNVKQLSLSLLNYHDTFRSLPYGNRSDGQGGMGVSFYISTWPFTESRPMFDKLSWGPNDGDLSGTAHPGGGANYQAFVVSGGGIMPYAYCPTNPMPSRTKIKQIWITVPSYVGIAGADRPGPADDGRLWIADNGMGRIARNGVLLSDEIIRLSDIHDGTAHTFAIAECSNWTYGPDGRSADRRPGVALGFPAGSDGGGINRRTSWLLTLRAQPPFTTGRINASVDLDAADGVHSPDWHRRNTPFTSAHRGGAHFGVLDGAVRFLSNDTSFEILAAACVRDDSQ